MDLTTAYLGLRLKNPLIASASPLTLDLDNIRRLEDYGAAAVVLPSIFEEQIEAEAMEIERLTHGRQSRALPRRCPIFRPHRQPERAAPLPRPHPAGARGGRHPSDREPQRYQPGGLA